MRYTGVRNVITTLLIRSGLRPQIKSQKLGKRTEVMADHGLRKFFSSTLETEGVNPVYIELLMNHNMGMKTIYSRPTPTQLLEGNGNKVLGYIHGINALTINEENRLKHKVQELEQVMLTDIDNKIYDRVAQFMREYSLPLIKLH